MNLFKIFILFLSLYSSCRALENNTIIDFSSELKIDPSLIQRNSENLYWNVYEPVQNIHHDKFIIFPKKPDLRSKIKAISFFLDPFKMVIFYESSPSYLPLLKEIFLLNFDFIDFVLPGHTHITLNENHFINNKDAENLINSLNEKNKLNRYTISLKILKDFQKIFPNFPLEIFSKMEFFQKYTELETYVFYCLENSFPPSTISCATLEYLENELKVDELNKQELLVDLMQELYIQVQQTSLLYPTSPYISAKDIFLDLSQSIKNPFLPDFALIKFLAANLIYNTLYQKNPSENLPSLIENLLEASQNDKNNMLGAKSFLFNLLLDILGLEKFSTLLKDIDISPKYIANLLNNIILLQQRNDLLQQKIVFFETEWKKELENTNQLKEEIKILKNSQQELTQNVNQSQRIINQSKLLKVNNNEKRFIFIDELPKPIKKSPSLKARREEQNTLFIEQDLTKKKLLCAEDPLSLEKLFP